MCRQKIDCEDGDASVFPGGYINVIRDPESGMYKYWYPASGGNGHSLLCYLESEDGFTWTKPDLGFARKLGLDASLQNCVSFDQYPTVFCKVTYDPYDSDPARRYKLVAE